MRYYEVEMYWSFEGVPSKDTISVLVEGENLKEVLESIENSKYKTGDIESVWKMDFDGVLLRKEFCSNEKDDN